MSLQHFKNIASEPLKSLWIDEDLDYDGRQLSTQFAYLNYKVLGDSIIAFAGRCNIDFQNMLDGEDLLDQSPIRGDRMLHFICEVYHENLKTGVALQRLFATVVKETLITMNPKAKELIRTGDDLFLGDKKLSISVATQSHISTLFHFAVNIVNDGTPVPTLSLQDLDIDPKKFAQLTMKSWAEEFASIREATMKVRPV